MSAQQPQSLESSYLALIEFLMLSKRHIVQAGASHDLNGMQALTLFLLDRPRPMRDFIAIFNCDPSNVTGIVDFLETKQLVERSENPSDRRIKMVQLLPAGTVVRANLVAQLTGTNSDLRKLLTPQELATFIQLMSKITAPQIK